MILVERGEQTLEMKRQEQIKELNRSFRLSNPFGRAISRLKSIFTMKIKSWINQTKKKKMTLFILGRGSKKTSRVLGVSPLFEHLLPIYTYLLLFIFIKKGWDIRQRSHLLFGCLIWLRSYATDTFYFHLFEFEFCLFGSQVPLSNS